MMKKTQCPKCKGKGCSHCGGKGYHTGMNKGGVMNEGMKALKKKAPAVAKKMGYKHGGTVTKKGMSYGGMAKKKMGMNKGGMSNCGASMQPNRMSKS